MAADGHLGMMALSRVTLASAGLSCYSGYGHFLGVNDEFYVLCYRDCWYIEPVRSDGRLGLYARLILLNNSAETSQSSHETYLAPSSYSGFSLYGPTVVSILT